MLWLIAYAPTSDSTSMHGIKKYFSTEMIFEKRLTPSIPTMRNARFAASIAPNTAYTISRCSTNIIGPGWKPCMIKAPMSTAVFESPGTPSESIGIIAPPEHPLFADSAAAIPSGAP